MTKKIRKGYNKKYYEKNKENINKKRRVYYEKNREKLINTVREWAKNNPERHSFNVRKSQRKRRNALRNS